ncbi:MAG: hypothetical protein ACJ74H_04745 [Thermoanaerobaculia bacterium]
MLLGIAFAAAVWLRLRSLEAREAVVQTASAATSATALADGTTTSAPGTEAEPYTIEPYGSTSTTTQRNETQAQRSAREQRYEELLRSAPPPAPAPQPRAEKPAETPTLFERVVNPIASALGINRPKPQQQNASMNPPQRQPSPPPNASPAESPRTSTSEEPRNPNEDDRETDVIPPQLLSAEFIPPQVGDGEETMLIVMVQDNLSGVRSVSGVITSPSGSLQGFACSREGDSNRFVARINIPKDAPEGVWTVKYLTLSDNASNSVNLNQAQGSLPRTAVFSVRSSTSDSVGPVLRSVWLDRAAMRAGEKNTLFVQADDEKSGVSFASGVFVSPGKAARIGFACRAGSGGVWECPVTPGTCLDCGLWVLEQVQLQDKANNMSTFRGDNQFVKAITLDIAGDSCDATAPTMTMITLNPTVVSNAQASVITVQATLHDEGGCGASTLSAQAVPPGGVGGQRRPVTFMPSTDGTTFIGRLEIPQFAAKGEWSIAWIQALDKGGNLRAYGANDPVVAKATFRVE